VAAYGFPGQLGLCRVEHRSGKAKAQREDEEVECCFQVLRSRTYYLAVCDTLRKTGRIAFEISLPIRL